jgi:hypothetical protein
MSQHTSDAPYYLSGYPPPPHTNFSQMDYKSSSDDLVEVIPYGKSAQHQTFAIETPALGSPHYPPSISAQHQKQSYSSEHSGKSTDEGMHPSAPRTVPLNTSKEVDSRTFWQKILPESLACRLYVITVLVQTSIDIAIEGDLFVRFHKGDADPGNPDKMPAYLSIFALAHVFQFAMAVDAVYARNTLQFISLTIFNALFLLYSIIQITEIRQFQTELNSTTGISRINVSILTIAIPIVISIAELIYVALAWKIYHEFGWKVYKFLGADRRIKKMYASYQVFQCLIKFDVFFWVGFSVQFIWLVLKNNDWEYYVTCAALPLSIVLLVEGHLAARHENKWMMATFMSGCISALIYFVYKLARVLMNKDTQFQTVWKSLSTFSMIAIVLLLVTFVFAVIVLRNFGRGLKHTMTKNQKEHTRWGSQHLHHRAMSTNPNRMSID